MEGLTMKKIFFRNRWWVIGISLFLILGAGKTVQASGITEGLKATIDQVIGVVTDPQLKNDRPTRRAKMKDLIFPKFNFLEMGKRSLGNKHWKEISPEERKALSIYSANCWKIPTPTNLKTTRMKKSIMSMRSSRAGTPWSKPKWCEKTVPSTSTTN